MLRDRLNDTLKNSLRAKDVIRTGTVRLILAALKDKDIAAREKGNYEGIGEEEILQLLQSMIKQRKESIALYEQGNRLELAAAEAKEVEIIQEFLPKQLSNEEIEEAINRILKKLDAHSIKDMGRVMAELKAQHSGTMDFSQVALSLKEKLK